MDNKEFAEQWRKMPHNIMQKFINKMQKCPLCGSMPKLVAYPNGVRVDVSCSNPMCNEYYVSFFSIETAVKRWNEYARSRISTDKKKEETKPPMTEKLKPCPFCGSSKLIIDWPIADAYGYIVFCKECGCEYHSERQEEDEAITGWNTRADLRPYGKWRRYDDPNANAWECSKCGEVWQLMEGTPEENHMNYCHNCGAKMSMEDENHDAHA